MTAYPSTVVFSTGNIITTGRTIAPLEKSNQELINSLRQNFKEASDINRSSDTKVISSLPAHSGIASWIQEKDETLYVPGLTEPAGLNEEREEYDITVKLFYLPDVPVSERCTHTRIALDYVLEELRVAYIDLLIVSFPNISFDAEDLSSNTEPSNEEVEEWIQTYKTLEALHSQGKIRRIGLAEFGVARLEKILPNTNIKPSVDQINVRDCCVVPKPLIRFAKEQKIELLTHNDCTNILPSSSLHNLLQEDGTLFSHFKNIDPQWVIKYTAVIQDRGVVENKG
ncbi:hypothetical protein H072_2712 [Dactylellina haptotyla CBS 200.50]|uniref:GCS light chain n=1 Tax=Dactylellina haptotyla (strain CBS 200.50) TaxID=1284197 RepID=S8AK69_DACHA|nr:hypothetical protein H072_2712 [Dactylellina haptotyla CBS 200.50]